MKPRTIRNVEPKTGEVYFTGLGEGLRYEPPPRAAIQHDLELLHAVLPVFNLAVERAAQHSVDCPRDPCDCGADDFNKDFEALLRKYPL